MFKSIFKEFKFTSSHY